MRYVELFCGIGGFRVGLDPIGMECVLANDFNPSACKVYRAKFGDVVEKDVRKLDAADVPDHDLMTAGFPCFTEDTMVLTFDGYKKISDVRIGDLVLTHKARWRKVTSTMSRKNASLVKIIAGGVPGVRTTYEHPFWARNSKYAYDRSTGNRARKLYQATWIPANELTTMHRLSQAVPEAIIDDEKTAVFWWLVGLYLADGWRVRRKGRKNGRVVLCCSLDEKQSLSRMIKKVGYKASIVRENSIVKFHITKGEFYEFLEPFGKYAHGKKIPGFVFQLPHDKLKAMLEGYLCGDESLDKNGWVANSTSKALALSMALVSQKVMGVVSGVRLQKVARKKTILGRTVNQKPYYQIRIPFRNRSNFVEGNFGWKKIKKIQECGSGTVFNISVDEDESYIADGAIVHNCQSFSTSGKNLGFSDERGNLFFEVHRILKAKRPACVLLENVKGLLTNDKGRTIRVILDMLGELDYRCDVALLDASLFGVPQKRVRTFILGLQRDFFPMTGNPSSRHVLAGRLPGLATLIPGREPVKGDLSSLRPSRKLALQPRLLEALREKVARNPRRMFRIRDNRLGKGSIPTWKVGLLGEVSERQERILDDMRRLNQEHVWSLIDKKGDAGSCIFRFTSRKLKATTLELDQLAEMGYIRKADGRYNLINRTIIPGGLPSCYAGPKGTAPTTTASNMAQFGLVMDDGVYGMSPEEYEQIQGFPAGHTAVDGLSDRERIRLVGNSVVPAVAGWLGLVAKRVIET